MTTPQSVNKPGAGRLPKPFLTRRQFLSATASVAALSAMSPAIVRGAGGSAATSTVVIVKGAEVEKMVAEAIDLLGGIKQFVKDGQKVTLKPNLVYQPDHRPDWTPDLPAAIQPAFTTDVRITEAVIRQIQQAAQCKISVAEGTPESAAHMFQYLGYTAMAKRTGVELVDVDKAPRLAVSLPNGLANKSYPLPVATQTSDVMINLPVLKNHHFVGVTVGVKNLFGLVPMPKSKYHRNLPGVLCDLHRAHPAALTIVDALYGMEGQGPLEGRPVKMDLIVAGVDVVAVDAVCTALMGFDPLAVEYLVYAHEHGLGEIDLKNITIKGVPLKQVRRHFEHALWRIALEIPQDEAVLKKLKQLAESETDEGGEFKLQFGAERLQVNAAKYPRRKCFGFSAWYEPKGKTIRLESKFERLIAENGRAAEEELRQWVRMNLGKDIEPKLMVDS